MSAALKGVPDTWYKQPADIIVGPAAAPATTPTSTSPAPSPARPPTARTTAQTPLPTQTCTYAGPTQAPPPPTPIQPGSQPVAGPGPTHPTPPCPPPRLAGTLAGARPRPCCCRARSQTASRSSSIGSAGIRFDRGDAGVRIARAARTRRAHGRRPRCGAPAGPRPRRGRAATTSSRGSRRRRPRAPQSVRAAAAPGSPTRRPRTRAAAARTPRCRSRRRRRSGRIRPGVSWSITASSTATPSSLDAELTEIEEVGTAPEHPEAFAGDRVAALSVELGDADHERLGADGARGQRCPDDRPRRGRRGRRRRSAARSAPARSPPRRARRRPRSAPRSGCRRAARAACPGDRGGSGRARRGSSSAGSSQRSCPVAPRDHSPNTRSGTRASRGAIGRLNRVTDAAPPTYAAPPPGPNPVALAIAYDLVTRYRLRLADQRDGRLGDLLGHYVLAAAMWNGPRAALVAFYEPPADPAAAGPDLAARCDAARRWGLERLAGAGCAGVRHPPDRARSTRRHAVGRDQPRATRCASVSPGSTPSTPTPARCCRSRPGCRRWASCAPGCGRCTTGRRRRRSRPSTSPSARRSPAATSRRCAARWSPSRTSRTR